MSAVSTIVDNATSTVKSQTGVGIDDLVAYVGSNFVMPVFGAGVGLFYDLRYWIIALVIFGAVVFFVYRWFKFSHH